MPAYRYTVKILSAIHISINDVIDTLRDISDTCSAWENTFEELGEESHVFDFLEYIVREARDAGDYLEGTFDESNATQLTFWFTKKGRPYEEMGVDIRERFQDVSETYLKGNASVNIEKIVLAPSVDIARYVQLGDSFCSAPSRDIARRPSFE